MHIFLLSHQQNWAINSTLDTSGITTEGGISMADHSAHGKHVFLDFTGYEPQINDDGSWMLDVLERAVEQSDARNVHAHVAQFDGSVSPIGFAAVVLLDESHVTAHCYSENGWLAIDCFTCGGSDPALIADFIQGELERTMPQLNLKQRRVHDRFLHREG